MKFRMNAGYPGRGASFLVVVAGAAVVPILIASLGWDGWFQLLRVPVWSPHFLDLHIITAGAPCATEGIDVYHDGRCDPLGRKFNLPPVWLLLGQLGLTDTAAYWLAPVFETGAVLVFATLMRGRTIGVGVAGLAALLSPSVMLGFERGNVDLLIFVFVGSAALLLDDKARARLLASFGLLALAVMAKLYPIFCCAIGVRSGRMAVFGGALLLFGVIYVFAISDVFFLIRSNSDVTPFRSYSYLVPFMFVENFAPRMGFSAAGLSKGLLPTVVITTWCALVAGGSLALWRRGGQLCSISGGATGTAFTFGAAIYCGSFLFSSSNYAYRLVFLLLCLPQFFDWLDDPSIQNSRTRKMALILLALLYFLLWCLVGGRWIWPVISVCEYLAFAGLASVVLLNGLQNWSGSLAKLIAMRRGSS